MSFLYMIIHIEGNFVISIDNESIIEEFYSIKKVRHNLNSSLLYFHYEFICDVYYDSKTYYFLLSCIFILF